MTRLKRSLKNSAKRGLLLSLCIAISCLTGCSSSTKPTFLKENIATAIQQICKDEYKLDVRTKLVGETLWVYIPLEDTFKKSDKPTKSLERFAIEENKNEFNEGIFKSEFLIKTVPEKEKVQEYGYDKVAAKNINSVMRVVLRVLSSMEREKKSEPRFIYMVTADIKNGFVIKELFYYLDFKKMAYDFISSTEFQHRIVQDIEITPEFIGDKEGVNLEYRDIPFEEFISGQVQNRIQLKFQKPEVEKDADIDKEILKIVENTFKVYGFRDFTAVELYNIATKNRIILNRIAVLQGETQ